MKSTLSDVLLTLDILWKSGEYQKKATLSWAIDLVSQDWVLPSESEILTILQSLSFEPNYIYQLGSLKDEDGNLLFNESILNYLQRFKNSCTVQILEKNESKVLEISGSISQILVYQQLLPQKLKSLVFEKTLLKKLSSYSASEIIYYSDNQDVEVNLPFPFTKTNDVVLAKKKNSSLWNGYSMKVYELFENEWNTFEYLLKQKSSCTVVPISSALLEKKLEEVVQRLNDTSAKEVLLESTLSSDSFKKFQAAYQGKINLLILFAQSADYECDAIAIQSSELIKLQQSIEQKLMFSMMITSTGSVTLHQ